jgi:hypothetical protein
VPVAKARSIAIERQKGFAKKTFVETLVLLKLDFTVVDNPRPIGLRGQKDPVDFKLGFLDADGVEPIVGGVGGLLSSSKRSSLA